MQQYDTECIRFGITLIPLIGENAQTSSYLWTKLCIESIFGKNKPENPFQTMISQISYKVRSKSNKHNLPVDLFLF